MSIIDLKKNDELLQKIINITKTKSNLIISFDNDYMNIINSFFSNLPIKNTHDNYIVSNNYFYQIDLLEYSVPNSLDIYLWFINCIEIANNIINSKLNKYIELFGSNINIWKISLCKNIMFNYPFTLDDVIFFPIDYVIKEFNLNQNQNQKIINTLVHEKIHIAQRFNEFVWEKFIQQNNSNWKKINSNYAEFNLINLNLINLNLFTNKNLLEKDYVFIFNPDTTYHNFKYVWISDDDCCYYGHYVFNKKNKKINKKYFKLDMEKKLLILTDFNLEEEHPYEIYAYKISDELTNNLYNK